MYTFIINQIITAGFTGKEAALLFCAAKVVAADAAVMYASAQIAEDDCLGEYDEFHETKLDSAADSRRLWLTRAEATGADSMLDITNRKNYGLEIRLKREYRKRLLKASYLDEEEVDWIC